MRKNLLIGTLILGIVTISTVMAAPTPMIIDPNTTTFTVMVNPEGQETSGGLPNAILIQGSCSHQSTISLPFKK
ncbi:MAG: hypothetical protein EXR81_02830 [Gammaproteobacteria bacterium]|nr:hypothetical protein [Gammaproteobacteria bacterium]